MKPAQGRCVINLMLTLLWSLRFSFDIICILRTTALPTPYRWNYRHWLVMTRLLLGVVSQWAEEKLLLLSAMCWSINLFMLGILPAQDLTTYWHSLCPGGHVGHWVPLALSKMEATHMGHTEVAIQPPGIGNLVAHKWFLIIQDKEVHRVFKSCMFHGRLELC